MDWLTFISKIVEALVWPVTVLVVVVLFRSEVLARLPFLRELSLPGGVAAKFDAKLDKLETATEAAAESAVTPPPVDRIALRANPTGVIMEKWKEVESAARALFSKRTVANRLYVISQTPAQVFTELNRRGLIGEQEMEWLRELHSMRNMAAHHKIEFTDERVSRYVELADRVLGSLVQTMLNTPAPNEAKGKPEVEE